MSTITALGVGSGLDLSGLLDQLRDAERGKLEPIQRQQEQQQAKISAFGQLQSSLSSFQDSVAKLNDASLYESLSTSVRGDALTASADKSAQPGSYNVEVTQLATAGTLATTAADTRDQPLFTQADTLTLEFGATYDDVTGELNSDAKELRSVEITVEENWTLEDLRDAINADEEAGVTASIVNDGSGYRLALASQATGADASLTGLTFAHADLGEDADTLRAGRDASLSVNGIAITSATNKVEGAIQGVTLNLEETTEAGQPLVLRVEQDTLKAREAVQGFVKAFNDMKETIGKLTAFNAETGQAGELNGDSAVRTIEARLRGVLAGGAGEGELRTLNQVGITLQRDGTLKLDETKLNELTRDNMSGLGEFFAGADSKGGLAGSLNTTLEQLLDRNGVVKRSIDGAESRVKSLGERFERMEVSIERTLDRYRVQFGQLDSMIAQMNQTSDYLAQQFDMLADLGNPRKR